MREVLMKAENVSRRGVFRLFGLAIASTITIPATVSVDGNSLHAVGEFGIDRSDFGVKATSAFHGMVRIRDGLKFTFDIVGRRV